MEENFNDIINEFKRINKLGYIKGINNNLMNSAGLTFESLLGKKADSIYFPDYKNTEIKTTQRFSRYPITLFTSSFDGPNLFEANDLLNQYGRYDKEFINAKILITPLKFKEKVSIHDYYFELDMDMNQEILFINIYDTNFNFLKKRGIVNFKTLKDKLTTKLQNLCVIYASKKKIENDLFFRYYKIECYKLKNFDYFISLITEQKINISLSLRISRSGEYKGKNRNKNLVFSINKNNLELLFDKIYDYEN